MIVTEQASSTFKRLSDDCFGLRRFAETVEQLAADFGGVQTIGLILMMKALDDFGRGIRLRHSQIGAAEFVVRSGERGSHGCFDERAIREASAGVAGGD